MAADRLEHLTEILDEHDGDDRCGCLRNAALCLATEGPSALDGVIQTLSACLANHSAGHALRDRFKDSLYRSL